MIAANKTRHPNDENVQPAGSARAAGSQFASQHMLSYAVLAPRRRPARWQMLSRAVRGKVKNKGKLKGERASISCKSPRLCRVRPTVGSKGICLVTFGAKVTKTWGWEYERVWQRLLAPAAQAILSEGVSACGRTDTPTPPALFIPSLELTDAKSAYRYARLIGW